MQIPFQELIEITSGSFPDVVQFYDTSAEVFFIDPLGDMIGTPIKKINGIYSDPQLEAPNNISKDTNHTNLEIKTINGFGMAGSYKSDDTHKMIIYEFAYELDVFLNDSSLKYQLNNPINTFNLSLENPIDEGSDFGYNVAISENHALLEPGSKILLEFRAGESEPFDMGVMYIDRSSFSLLGQTASCEGRNLIGKALKDQTLDEQNVFPYDYIHEILETLLINANLNSDQYIIEQSTIQNSFSFNSKTTTLDAIFEVLKVTLNWTIEENTDGTIVIGSPSFYAFEQRSTYTFYRNKDIFSRDITRDDNEAYRRVCVQTNSESVKVYKDVIAYKGWNLQSKKTLYVDVPEGTSLYDATAYAEEIAARLENVGKIESFSGPFRPQLLHGDGAVIIDENSTLLGLITEIEHKPSKNGWKTLFTVDSGGQLNKGRISDYITKITQPKSNGSIGYEE